jgi:hypothetical protein
VTWDLGFSGLIRRTVPFNRLLRHTRRYGGSILTKILTGPLSVTFYDTHKDVDEPILTWILTGMYKHIPGVDPGIDVIGEQHYLRQVSGAALRRKPALLGILI